MIRLTAKSEKNPTGVPIYCNPDHIIRFGDDPAGGAWIVFTDMTPSGFNNGFTVTESPKEILEILTLYRQRKVLY